MRIAVVLALVAGCDRVYGLSGRGDAPPGDDANGPNDEAMVVDAMVCANPQFDPTEIVRIDGFEAGSSEPALGATGLELYFTKSTTNGVRIHRSERANAIGAWGSPLRVANLGSTVASTNDTDPSITADGRSLFFLSTRNTNDGTRQVFEARRLDVASPWHTPSLITTIALADVVSLDISADGMSLYVLDAQEADTPLYIYRRSDLDSEFQAPADKSALGISGPSVDATGEKIYAEGPDGIQRWARTGNMYSLDGDVVGNSTIHPDLSHDGRRLTFVLKTEQRMAYIEATCDQ